RPWCDARRRRTPRAPRGSPASRTSWRERSPRGSAPTHRHRQNAAYGERRRTSPARGSASVRPVAPLKLKNTYTKATEGFVPLQGGVATVYTCGRAVYSFAHIGNFRSFLFADVLCRVLAQRGYTVRQVMNISDVGHMTVDHLADASGEDKLSKAA